MLKMSEESRKFLEEHCPELLKENDLRSFLLEFSDFIVMYGLDRDDEMTEFGREAQRVYDEIYMCN